MILRPCLRSPSWIYLLSVAVFLLTVAAVLLLAACGLPDAGASSPSGVVSAAALEPLLPLPAPPAEATSW